jgi:DNA-binding NarL/FixJ family response regulator
VSRDRGTGATNGKRSAADVSVVLADHQHLSRHALRCMLETVPRYRIIGEVADALRVAPAVSRLRPQVLVVDFDIQPLSGPDVSLAVRQQMPGVGVVVVSRSTSDGHLMQCLRSGASGYVSKMALPEELSRAIDQAAAGSIYISAPFSRRPVDYWLRRAQEQPDDPYDHLTVRERQTLHLVAQGLSGTAIAQRLSISRRTVESHREHLKTKLGIRNHPGLVRYAVERQVLGLGPGSRRPGR